MSAEVKLSLSLSLHSWLSFALGRDIQGLECVTLKVTAILLHLRKNATVDTRSYFCI